MTQHDQALEQYRSQLNHWVAALALADNEAVGPEAAPRYNANDVHLFTEGNLAKRFEILRLQLSFLAPAFEDLDDLIDEYIATQPLAAFAAGPADAAACLHWLSESFDLTEEQADHVSCRLARYAVEDAARADRTGHLRFQERWSVAAHLARQLKRNPRLRVHLNPARGWAIFQSQALFDEEIPLPARVVFFAVGSEIHSAVLEEPIRDLLTLLEVGPLTLKKWAGQAGRDVTADFLAVVRRLSEIGMLAFS